jgi:hypothetical protein
MTLVRAQLLAQQAWFVSLQSLPVLAWLSLSSGASAGSAGQQSGCAAGVKWPERVATG